MRVTKRQRRSFEEVGRALLKGPRGGGYPLYDALGAIATWFLAVWFLIWYGVFLLLPEKVQGPLFLAVTAVGAASGWLGIVSTTLAKPPPYPARSKVVWVLGASVAAVLAYWWINYG